MTFEPPVLGLAVPRGQFTGGGVNVGQDEPAGQEVHDDELAALYVPASQTVHSHDVVGEYVPSGHSRHVAAHKRNMKVVTYG